MQTSLREGAPVSVLNAKFIVTEDIQFCTQIKAHVMSHSG